MATATRAAGEVSFRSAEEMEEVLDRVLSQVDADEKAGPLLRATGMRLRLRCPDVDFAVNIAASEDPGRCIGWTFAKQPPWEPKLELTMSSAPDERPTPTTTRENAPRIRWRACGMSWRDNTACFRAQ